MRSANWDLGPHATPLPPLKCSASDCPNKVSQPSWFTPFTSWPCHSRNGMCHSITVLQNILQWLSIFSFTLQGFHQRLLIPGVMFPSNVQPLQVNILDNKRDLLHLTPCTCARILRGLCVGGCFLWGGIARFQIVEVDHFPSPTPSKFPLLLLCMVGHIRQGFCDSPGATPWLDELLSPCSGSVSVPHAISLVVSLSVTLGVVVGFLLLLGPTKTFSHQLFCFFHLLSLLHDQTLGKWYPMGAKCPASVQHQWADVLPCQTLGDREWTRLIRDD